MDVRQRANQNKYDRAASSYNCMAYLLSLGQIRRIYNEIAENVPRDAKQLIVEMGCGPGAVIPALLERIHPESRIVGIDFSQKMIEIANRKKTENDWQNVTFLQQDMYDYPGSEKVDCLIFCLSLTAIPDTKRALQKALTLLKPGGQLLILDSIPLHTRWYHPIANGYTYLKSMIVGAKPTDKILSFIDENMVEIRHKELLGGVYSLVSAKKW